MQEERTTTTVAKSRVKAGDTPSPTLLIDIPSGSELHISTGLRELDDVLGGGIVPGGVLMLAGDPGIGKSTIFLQVADHLANRSLDVVYISGEESLPQVRRRALRLGLAAERLAILNETDWPRIEAALRQNKPQAIVVDSIQTLRHPEWPSPPGTVGQIRECAQAIIDYCKRTDTTALLIGHVTKEGAIAGPKVLEHMVDTVLHFEGEQHQIHRIIRAVKNRFGPTNDIGVFEMTEHGLREIADPSGLFLGERQEDTIGSVIGCAIEGRRPFLLELQALVTPTHYGSPQRVSTGVDHRRLVLLLAILEKRCGLAMGTQDVFANIAGGFKSAEPALDLALAAGLISAFSNAPLPANVVAIGEVGLTGEIRAVPFLETRLRESEKLGFTRAIIPQGNVQTLEYSGRLDVSGLRFLSELQEQIS